MCIVIHLRARQIVSALVRKPFLRCVPEQIVWKRLFSDLFGSAKEEKNLFCGSRNRVATAGRLPDKFLDVSFSTITNELCILLRQWVSCLNWTQLVNRQPIQRYKHSQSSKTLIKLPECQNIHICETLYFSEENHSVPCSSSDLTGTAHSLAKLNSAGRLRLCPDL